jgi:hypothetical protein
MMASELLSRVVQTYRTVPSYGDTGTVTISFGEQGIVTAQFATRFVRPAVLQFTCVDEEKGRMAVRVDGGTAEVDLPDGSRHVYSPSLGVAAVAGISHGAAAFIPGLLMPEALRVRPLIDLEAISCPPANETADSPGCIRLAGSRRVHRAENRGESDKLIAVTLWIDATTFLVRRFVRPRIEPGSHLIIEYRPTPEGR